VTKKVITVGSLAAAAPLLWGLYSWGQEEFTPRKEHESLAMRVSVNELESSYHSALKNCLLFQNLVAQNPNNAKLKQQRDQACKIMERLLDQLCREAPSRCVRG